REQAHDQIPDQLEADEDSKSKEDSARFETSAKPIPNFAPLYKDNPSGPKIVDFSINLVPPHGSSLESAIHALLLHEPPQFLSIN
ncbi:hypothetical protein A1F96_10892, partial [Pyrenophora tritici-repentis]